MNSAIDKNSNSRAMAVMICLFLLFLYKELVFDPYFYPNRNNAAVTHSTQPTAPAVPIDPAQEFALNRPHSDASPVANPVANPSVPTATTPAGDSADHRVYPADKLIEDGGLFSVKTENITADVSLLGGRLTHFRLNDYAAVLPSGIVGSKEKTDERNNAAPRLDLVEHIEHAPYPLGVYSGNVSDDWVKYQPVDSSVTSGLVLAPEDSKSVVLQGDLPDGRKITKTLTFHGQGYFVDVSVKLGAPAPDSSRLVVEWTKLIAKDSPNLLDPYKISGYVWFDGQKALRQPFAKLTSDLIELNNLRWISIADKYFMVAIVSPETSVNGRALRTGQLYRSEMDGTDVSADFKIFGGPKSYRMLDDVGYELKRSIDFGWTGVIAAPLLWLLHTLYGFLGNYGLAIVMLTITVKFALYPLTASSFRQMKALQDISPEIKKIRESTRDKQQQQVEMMALYKKRGVNPLGGCLPMLVQMPVFIGLYSALQLAIELRHAPFALWINDLSAPEKLMMGSMGVPVMVLLFVISMLIQQWITPSTADPAQKRIMMVMPLVMGFMFANMPAGLTLYWLTNNLISIGQQAGLRRVDGKAAFKLTAAVASTVFAIAFILSKVS